MKIKIDKYNLDENPYAKIDHICMLVNVSFVWNFLHKKSWTHVPDRNLYFMHPPRWWLRCITASWDVQCSKKMLLLCESTSIKFISRTEGVLWSCSIRLHKILRCSIFMGTWQQVLAFYPQLLSLDHYVSVSVSYRASVTVHSRLNLRCFQKALCRS